MLYFLFCSISESSPTSTPSVQIPAPVANELVIPLEQTQYCDGGMHAPRTKEDLFEIRHPDEDNIELYYSPNIGNIHLMVGLEQGEHAKRVSADINQNGRIEDNERFTMVKQKTDENDDKYVAEFKYPYPTDEDPDYKLDITLAWVEKSNQSFMETCVESGRSGTIPVGDGLPVFVTAKGGDFSLPETTLIIDADGDGKPDVVDHLHHFSLKEGLIQLTNGQVYTIDINQTGTVLKLRPTDQVLTGLHLLSPAPNFEAKATDGQIHSLSQYKGEFVLLDFWATWCGPCIALHPKVEEFAAEHQLTVLGISADDTLSDVKRWLKKNPTPWPSIAQGPGGEINLAYNVNSWPTHVLVDPQGRLVAYGRWETIVETVENETWKSLEQPVENADK